MSGRAFTPGLDAIAIAEFVHAGKAYKRGDPFPTAGMHQTQIGGLWMARLIDFVQPVASTPTVPPPKPPQPQQNQHRR